MTTHGQHGDLDPERAGTGYGDPLSPEPERTGAGPTGEHGERTSDQRGIGRRLRDAVTDAVTGEHRPGAAHEDARHEDIRHEDIRHEGIRHDDTRHDDTARGGATGYADPASGHTGGDDEHLGAGRAATTPASAADDSAYADPRSGGYPGDPGMPSTDRSDEAATQGLRTDGDDRAGEGHAGAQDHATTQDHGATQDLATGRGAAGATGGAVPGDGAAGEGGAHEPLFPRQRADEYAARWDAVKGGFVDDPRQAVGQADQLVGELLDELQELFRAQRQGLEQDLDADEVSTEDLRLALRRYRSFFDRLLKF